MSLGSCRGPDLIGHQAKYLGLPVPGSPKASTLTSCRGGQTTRQPHRSGEWLNTVAGQLDWAALSIDSVEPDTLVRTGRTTRNGPMTAEDYLCAARVLRDRCIRVKVNTVVSRSNLHEDLSGFIIEARPERWKLLQVLPAGRTE